MVTVPAGIEIDYGGEGYITYGAFGCRIWAYEFEFG